MSLTVSRQPPWTPRSAATREERRGLHLDREHPSLRPALVLPLVRVVEEVARHDRADAKRLSGVLRDVDRLVDELPARGRAVRLAADEVRRGRVRRDGGDRDDEVAERVVGLQAAARADAQETRDAELDQLLEHDRRSRTAHARSLHGDALALPRPGVAEQAALLVHLRDVGEEGLGDVLRPERIAGQEAGVRVVAGLGAEVDRHGGTLRVPPWKHGANHGRRIVS